MLACLKGGYNKIDSESSVMLQYDYVVRCVLATYNLRVLRVGLTTFDGPAIFYGISS